MGLIWNNFPFLRLYAGTIHESNTSHTWTIHESNPEQLRVFKAPTGTIHESNPEKYLFSCPEQL